jgi:Flp pilus assembly protein TadB
MITLEKIRQKTRELHARTRRALLQGILVPLIVIFVAGYGIAWFDGPAVRAVFTFALVWSLAGQYLLHRGMWSATLPEDAGLSNGLESYRREVERRRDLSSRFLSWALGPAVLAIAAFTVPLVSLGIRKGVVLNMAPFLTLLVIWVVSVFVVRMRNRRELQREIQELNDIERANG